MFGADDDDEVVHEQKKRKLRKIEYTDEELRSMGIDPEGRDPDFLLFEAKEARNHYETVTPSNRHDDLYLCLALVLLFFT